MTAALKRKKEKNPSAAIRKLLKVAQTLNCEYCGMEFESVDSKQQELLCINCQIEDSSRERFYSSSQEPLWMKEIKDSIKFVVMIIRSHPDPKRPRANAFLMPCKTKEDIVEGIRCEFWDFITDSTSLPKDGRWSRSLPVSWAEFRDNHHHADSYMDMTPWKATILDLSNNIQTEVDGQKLYEELYSASPEMFVVAGNE